MKQIIEFGLIINRKDFIPIGDKIDIDFINNTHEDGKLENINIENNEIILNGEILDLKDIKQITRIKENDYKILEYDKFIN